MSFKVKRIIAYNRQRGRCCYCLWPMWEAAIEPEADAKKRINAVRQNRRDEISNLKSFICTAEHVERQAEGGLHGQENILAACSECNSGRGELNTDDHALEQQERSNFDQAGHDRDFDPVFYQMPNLPITERYHYKWHHNFFVEVPRWRAEVEAMRLGDFNKVGWRYQTADSIAVVFPRFTSNRSSDTPETIYKHRQIIDGAQLLLENARHARALKKVFKNEVVGTQKAVGR